MGINRKILKILERCASEYDEVAKFKGLLTEDCLRLKEPVSLEKLKEFRFSMIISQVGLSERNSQLATKLMENIHRTEPTYMPLDNFI